MIMEYSVGNYRHVNCLGIISFHCVNYFRNHSVNYLPNL